jgi:hypothetical protein
MMKIFRNSSRKLTGQEENEETHVDRKGSQRNHDSRPNSEKSLEYSPPESSPVAAESSPVATASMAVSAVEASPGGMIDDAFFVSPQRMQDWDEWSVPKEGSSNSKMTIRPVSKALSMTIVSPTK